MPVSPVLVCHLQFVSSGFVHVDTNESPSTSVPVTVKLTRSPSVTITSLSESMIGQSLTGSTDTLKSVVAVYCPSLTSTVTSPLPVPSCLTVLQSTYLSLSTVQSIIALFVCFVILNVNWSSWVSGSLVYLYRSMTFLFIPESSLIWTLFGLVIVGPTFGLSPSSSSVDDEHPGSFMSMNPSLSLSIPSLHSATR